MRVYEFGTEHDRTFVMFQCAAEPWWVFKSSAEAMAQDFHVLLFIADGHDELGTDFVSIEKSVDDAASYLKGRGIDHVDVMYGCSMGGASTIRFLATQKIDVDRAIIDAGITPYPYPRPLCRLISLWDFITITLATKNYALMKLAMPPERWTPKDEDPEEHYRKIFEFERDHFSAKTIYNVFWSTNNYTMPDPVPSVATRIEYEKRVQDGSIIYDEFDVTPDSITYRISGCRYVDMFEAYGIRGLCKIFCKTDMESYAGLTRHVSFTRHSDLSDGDSCFDEIHRR